MYQMLFIQVKNHRSSSHDACVNQECMCGAVKQEEEVTLAEWQGPYLRRTCGRRAGCSQRCRRSCVSSPRWAGRAGRSLHCSPDKGSALGGTQCKRTLSPARIIVFHQLYPVGRHLGPGVKVHLCLTATLWWESAVHLIQLW